MTEKGAKPKHFRLTVYLQEGAYKQLLNLKSALHVGSLSALVAQSLARWHGDEPLVHAWLKEQKEQALVDQATAVATLRDSNTSNGSEGET